MAALLGELRTTITADFRGFDESLASVGKALDAAAGVREHFADDIARLREDCGPDEGGPPQFNGFDLLRFEEASAPANRVTQIVIRCAPDRGYWELVSAISRDLRGGLSFELLNGWPILSRVDPSPDTLTEAAGESFPGGGGSEA